MAENFDVLIRFITEMVGGDGAEKTVENISSLESKLAKVNKSLEEQKKKLAEQSAMAAKLAKALKDIPYDDPKFKQASDDLEKSNDAMIKQIGIVENLTESQKDLNNQIGKLSSDQQKALRDTASHLNQVSSILSGISNTLVVGGTAVTGGLFKMASDFIKNSEEATALTKEWNRQTDYLKQAYSRVGAVAEAEILPFLKEAAQVTDRIASFIEKNPDIVGGALKVGMIALAVGTIGKAVSSGIKLVADATTIAISATQLAASANNVLAAAGMNLASLTFATTVSAVLIPALVIFAGILSGVLVGLMAYEAIAQNSDGKLPTLETLGTQSAEIIKRKSEEIWEKLTEDLTMVGDAADETGDKLGELTDDFEQMREDESAANAQYEADRRRFITDSNNAISNEYNSHQANIINITRRAEEARAQIIENYARQAAADAAQYEADRAAIIRDGGVAIERIEQERLEKLRKLEMDHNDRVDELAANRDALGLVLEQERFEEEKAEIDRQSDIEIARRKQDMAIRLQDLAANFAAERAAKLAKYQQDLKDLEEKKKAELEQEKLEHDERMSLLFKQRADRLKEMAAQHREEMLRIRKAFLDKVRDLDASLIGEQQKRRQYQAYMLQDLEQFLASYRSGLSSGLGAGTIGRAAGGYVNGQLVQTHGVEFVTNPFTTRALERLIGGRLSQQNLVAAVAGGGGSSVVWNDQRRFSGEYTKSMRRENRKDTLGILGEVFRK